MVELDENRFEELTDICEDITGINSLLSAMNKGGYTHPAALRVLGNYLSDVQNHFWTFVEDLRKQES